MNIKHLRMYQGEPSMEHQNTFKKIYSLSDLTGKQQAKVVHLDSSKHPFRKKLLSMGLTPGVKVNILRKAPLGGPMELNLRGFSLSLRQNEAEHVFVRLL
jgi:ferrous iron transport protein A